MRPLRSRPRGSRSSCWLRPHGARDRSIACLHGWDAAEELIRSRRSDCVRLSEVARELGVASGPGRARIPLPPRRSRSGSTAAGPGSSGRRGRSRAATGRLPRSPRRLGSPTRATSRGCSGATSGRHPAGSGRSKRVRAFKTRAAARPILEAPTQGGLDAPAHNPDPRRPRRVLWPFRRRPPTKARRASAKGAVTWTIPPETFGVEIHNIPRLHRQDATRRHRTTDGSSTSRPPRASPSSSGST